MEQPVEAVEPVAQPDAAAAPSRGAPESEGESNVSPEEQAQYDIVITAARGILFGEATFKVVMDKLSGGKAEIGKTIGHTAAMVITSIKGGVEKQGREVPGDILFHAGEEVVADLIEMAVAAKLMQEADSERVTKEALFEGLKVFGEGEIAKGVTPEKRAAAQQEVSEADAQSKGLINSKMEA